MLDIQNQTVTYNCEGVSRRDFIRVGAVSMLGLTLADWFKMKRTLASDAYGQTKEGAEATPPKAKSVIQLWMWGGPSHLDTWDPKPQAGDDYCGPLKRPLATNVSGMVISELLPLMAKQADKYSIIRSMTHSNNGHETAAYIVLTGTLPSADLAYPCIGSVVSLKKGYAGGYKGSLPPYVALTSSFGRFSETGFLSDEYKSFATGGDPNSRDFRVAGLVLRGTTEKRFAERRSLLKAVDSLAKDMEKEGHIQTMDSYQEKAYGLIMGEAKKAFDMSQEKDELREKYGRNHFGQSCLLARRLVENGVPFVTVNMGGWDTHRDNFGSLKTRLLPTLDQGFSALIEDLAQRGLLESTIVVWYGEFGRTPRIANEAPWFGGRHHWGQVFSCVVAGGGFKGGQIVGASDPRGEQVRQRPVYPWDLSASIYKSLGIDYADKLPHPQGCVAYVSPLATGAVPSGGLLTEIM